jgi:AmiR/NasT family two-component response regulator
MAMALARLPADCRALVVENEPVQALALECLLEELGCRAVGPAGSVAEVEALLDRERPNFALVEGDLRAGLPELAGCLARRGVPFALLAVGRDGRDLDRIAGLAGRPHLARPFHAPSLRAVAGALYRADLEARVADADRHLEQGRARLARQLRLVERLAAAGADTAPAEGLAREYGRLLRTLRGSRALLGRRLDRFPG